MSQQDRKVVGQIVKDPEGKLYFESASSEVFDDDPVVVVRVEDYQKAIQDAVAAGARQSVLEKQK